MTTDILDTAEVRFPDCDGLPRWRLPDVHVRLNCACSHRTCRHASACLAAVRRILGTAPAAELADA